MVVGGVGMGRLGGGWKCMCDWGGLKVGGEERRRREVGGIEMEEEEDEEREREGEGMGEGMGEGEGD